MLASQSSPQQKHQHYEGLLNEPAPIAEGHSSIHKCQSPTSIVFASTDGGAGVIGHQFEIESREKGSPLNKELAQMHRSNMVAGRFQATVKEEAPSEFQA